MYTHREIKREREKGRKGATEIERDIHEIYVDIKIKLKHSKSARENFPNSLSQILLWTFLSACLAEFLQGI